MLIPIPQSLLILSTILQHTIFETFWEVKVPTDRITRSVFLFFLAGLCEIGGGWLVWQWLREEKGLAWALVGGIVLILYGIIPTFQPAHFGRVYAAYGGVFIVLSLVWGWLLDGNVPDHFDIVGAAIALVGVSVIMYWPR